METIDSSLNDLIPYARNPRNNEQAVDKVASSIKEFGFRQPIVVDEENVIIAGHTRYLAAQKLGMDQVPVHVAKGLTEQQVKAYRLADNRVSQEATWDMELLKLELPEIEGMFTGFDQDEIDELLHEPVEGLTDEDAVPEVPDEPVTKEGDIWILGNHRLMCGDSTSIDAVEKLMDGQKADMVFTSPPYNVGMNYSGHDDEMEINSYMDMITSVMECCYLIMNDGVLIGWNVGVSPKSKPYSHAVMLEKTGFELYRHIVWKKTGAQIPLWQNSIKKPFARNYMPNYNHEMIYMMKKGELTTGARTSMPDELSMDVWDISQFSAGGHNHPAAFPVKLAESAIMVMSCSGEIYFDPFGGSGTAMIACEKIGRCGYLMELDPKYCDVIVKRWQDFTGKEAILENSDRKVA